MATNTLPLFADAGKFYVYIYRDTRPGKRMAPIYVGKGTSANGRADTHWRRRSHNKMLNATLDKLRASGLEPAIEVVGWFDDEAAAFDLERHLISKFGRKDIGTGTLCNLSDGGDGATGWAPTPDTLARMSEAGKARMARPDVREKVSSAVKMAWQSPEYREAVRSAHVGAKRSDETRRKLSEARRRRVTTEETRERLSAAQKGRKHSPESIAKVAAFHLGRKRSPETRENISRARKDHAEERALSRIDDEIRKAAQLPEGERAHAIELIWRKESALERERKRRAAKKAATAQQQRSQTDV